MEEFCQTQCTWKGMLLSSNRKLHLSEASFPTTETRSDSRSAELDNYSGVADVWPPQAICKLHDRHDIPTELPILGDDGKIFDDDTMSLELVSPKVRTDELHSETSEPPNESTAPRKSRTRHWPEKSKEYPRYPLFADYRTNALELSIGSGMNAGRNLMAVFEDLGKTPRTRYYLRVERGRPLKQWPTAPSSEIVLPVGLTLAQICRHYSSHVWGIGLRLFMAEGWTGEEIWQALPKEARNDKAQHRKWNYLQQAMGREADRMYEEDNNPRRIPQKRKRVDWDIDTTDDDSADLYAGHQLKDGPGISSQACDSVFNLDKFVTAKPFDLEPTQPISPVLSPIEMELRESERLAAEALQWSTLDHWRNTTSYGGRQNFPPALPNLIHQSHHRQTATVIEDHETPNADRGLYRITPCPQNTSLSHPRPGFQPLQGPRSGPRAYCSCRKHCS